MTITSPHLGSSGTWTDARLLHALEEVVENELNRHFKVAKDWMPHEYVPWSDGRNFPGFFEDGEAWQQDQSKVTDIGRTALIVNLLTEDNLPSYHHEIASLFGRDGAWGTWVHRWTAEEGRHGTAIRDYLHVRDLADAHARALEHLEPGTHRIHNLGSGGGYSVREVLDAVRRITGHPVPVVDGPRRAGDPAILVAANDRARAELGWSPTRGLDEIVADAWEFTRKRVET